jgi:predicted RNase H-like nuclease (RuvC/YqgF family)
MPNPRVNETDRAKEVQDLRLQVKKLEDKNKDLKKIIKVLKKQTLKLLTIAGRCGGPHA